MSNPSDMTIAVQLSAARFFELEREASRKRLKVGEYAGQILSGEHQGCDAARPPSFEDVRLMIRDEVRKALHSDRAA